MDYQLEQTGQQVQNILNQAPTTEENLQNEITRSTNKDDELETAIENEETRAEGAEENLQTAIENEVSRAEGVEGNLQTAIESEVSRAEGIEAGLRSDVDAIDGKIPTGASDQNKLATEGFVNSSISSNTADFKGTYNSLEELQTEVPTATANDYAFVISTDASGNTVYNRYKYVTGTGWVFEYALNNSSFTAAQWSAINSAITSVLVAKLNGLPTAAELTQRLNAIIDSVATEKTRAEGIEAGLRTDVNTNAAAIVTEKNRAQGVEGTLQTSIVAEENRAKAAETLLQQNINAEALLRDNADDALQDEIDGIDAKIPTQASASNQLADKAFVNSSIATNTGEFKGTYNSLVELQAVTNVNANDYGFVIATDGTGNTVYNRYKYVTGQGWVFEYALNNSSFTAAQWGAINSGITAALAAKINGLPDIDALNAMFAAITSKIPADASSSNKLVDYAQLVYALSSKQNTLIFDNVPTENSNNPVKSGGVYTAIATVTAAVVGLQSSKQDVLTFDQYPTAGSDNPVRSTGIYSAIENAVAPKANQTDLDNAVIRISTNEVDIAQLQAAYRGLTQNYVVPVAPTDPWPVANPQENIIYRVADRTNTPPQYYTDYIWNGTVMVKMAQYNNAIDPRPKKASQNLVTSGGVFDNMGALDVSELNATENPHTLAQYADLSSALAAIPTDYQKGGMSIKFVQSSDNKYVQYRLMANSFSTTVTDWQGVDDEPTAGSKNLVESGGVYPIALDTSNIQKEVNSRLPFLQLNDTDSLLSYASMETISNRTGILKFLVTLPSDLSGNHVILGQPNKFMIGYNNGILKYYNYSVFTEVRTSISGYAGKTVLFKIDKRADNLVLIYIDDNFIDGANATADPTGDNNTLYVGSINGSVKTAIDIYYIQMYDQNKNLLWEINPYTKPTDFDNVRVFIGDKEVLGDDVATFTSGQKVSEIGIDNIPTENSNNIVKSGGVHSFVNKHTTNIYKEIDNRLPYLKLDGVTSFLSYADKEAIGTRSGRLRMLVKLPLDLSGNKLLLSYYQILMIGINNNQLRFYNYSSIDFFPNVAAYAGKTVLFEFEKRVNNELFIYINGSLVGSGQITPDPTGTDNTLYVGSNYAGSVAFDIDVYYVQMYDIEGNLLWEVNPYTEPTERRQVKTVVGNQTILELDDIYPKVLEYKDYVSSDCKNVGLLMADGTVDASRATYRTSDYILIKDAKTIEFEGLFSESSGSNPLCGIAIFDAKLSPIRHYATSGSFAVQNGDCYIRFSPLHYTENEAKVRVRYKAASPVRTYLDALPSKIHVTKNKEYNIYMDNVIIGYSEMGYLINVSAASNVANIQARNRCVRLNMTSTGNISTTWDLYDAEGNILETKNITIVSTEGNAGTGTKQFLFIGDSTIDNAIDQAYQGPQIVREFYNLCNNNLGFTPLLLGKKTFVEGGITYRHEGYAGQPSSYFIGSSSPFYYNGSINFSAYMADIVPQISGATNTIDYVIYQIGINDLKNSGDASTVITNIKTLATAILADYPNAKIIIGMPPTGNDAQGWAYYSNGSITIIKEYIPFRQRMMSLLVQIVSEFDNAEYNQNVYICNAGEMIDRIYGFPWELQAVSSRVSQTVLTHLDSVHPNIDGYNQMADAYFGRVKNLV